MFLVEGEKSVIETLNSKFTIQYIIATKPFLDKYRDILGKNEFFEVSEETVSSLSTMSNNRVVLAVVKQNQVKPLKSLGKKFYIALDQVRDPGNLGTIIRIADWYGVETIIASIGSAEFYNPKVISASMGSFTRVGIYYTDLSLLFSTTDLPIIGAFLKGESIHNFELDKRSGGILLMGSESHGISPELEECVTRKVTIQSLGGAESLNVAVSTGILMDNLQRISKE